MRIVRIRPEREFDPAVLGPPRRPGSNARIIAARFRPAKSVPSALPPHPREVRQAQARREVAEGVARRARVQEQLGVVRCSTVERRLLTELELLADAGESLPDAHELAELLAPLPVTYDCVHFVLSALHKRGVIVRSCRPNGGAYTSMVLPSGRLLHAAHPAAEGAPDLEPSLRGADREDAA